jgi:Lrp/AsnC family leucine-responsive transcriptional regulator
MIDGIDHEILNILQDNARTSNAEIARRVGMAPSAVLERVRKLERRGVIQGFEARIDPRSLQRSLTAFTLVRTEESVGTLATGESLKNIPGVLEVHYCAGQDSYLVKLRARDPEALAGMIREFGQIDTVRDTQTTVVLSTIKETFKLPLDTGPKTSGGKGHGR